LNNGIGSRLIRISISSSIFFHNDETVDAEESSLQIKAEIYFFSISAFERV
jgi:hypothetical protein